MSKLHIVSTNLKTDWSINFPIEETCHPTPLCMKVCYARKGRLAMPGSLTRQQRVLELFRKEDPVELAQAIADGYRRKQLTFLRWCGSGDLPWEAVQVLNELGENHQDTKHWIVTRKPHMVGGLIDAPNFHLMFSLDSTYASRQRKKTVDKIAHPRQYYSFLRERAGQDTMGAKIIFNLQQKKGELPYDDPKRVCPVDADKLPVEGACKQCRMCFQ